MPSTSSVPLLSNLARDVGAINHKRHFSRRGACRDSHTHDASPTETDPHQQVGETETRHDTSPPTIKAEHPAHEVAPTICWAPPDGSRNAGLAGWGGRTVGHLYFRPAKFRGAVLANAPSQSPTAFKRGPSCARVRHKGPTTVSVSARQLIRLDVAPRLHP